MSISIIAGRSMVVFRNERVRLDQLLVDRGFFGSRARARDTVMRGVVFVTGKSSVKPRQRFDDDVELYVRDPARQYASRAALKLLHGLDQFFP